MVILLMGVAGSGKTTLGRMLATELGWSFADADQFHPPGNIAKMSTGQALDDRDRAPWLAAIRAYIDHQLVLGRDAVVTCSALKRKYREALMSDPARMKLVYLKGSRELLWSRISAREGHFMKPEMLDGQLAALEEPDDALAVDIAPPAEQVIAAIRRGLSL